MTEIRNHQELLTQLDGWHQAGWLRAIDVNLAHLLAETETDAAVLLAAAWVSHQAGRGHTCLSLAALCQDADTTLAIPPYRYHQPLDGTEPLLTPAALVTRYFGSDNPAQVQALWCQALLASHAVTNHPNSDPAPFVLLDAEQGGRLYLRRYWRYEDRIQADLSQRLSRVERVDNEALQHNLTQLFASNKSSAPGEIDWQKVASANAIKYPFSVITGGPGTGKTYTVVRLLALLQNLAPTPLRITLAAPTGKAAARLKDSVTDAIKSLSNTQLKHGVEALPTQATTLHRLLGPQRHSRRFKHHRENPLRYDVVVVDEASMVDIEMLDALLDALPPHTRLILLGDKDQLASVEAGAILAALCEDAEHGHYQPEHLQWLKTVTGEDLPAALADEAGSARSQAVVMLRKSQRFDGPIADLATAINTQDIAARRAAISNPPKEPNKHAPIRMLTATGGSNDSPEARQRALYAQLRQLVTTGLADFKQAYSAPCDAADEDAVNDWAANVLAQFSKFQLLTAVKQGPWGQRGLNRQLSEWLGGKADGWFHGRPVMITSNDYSLNLRNGDIGVALRHPVDGLLKVALIDNARGDGNESVQIRWLLPSRLAHVDTVYAMTVHKSQGSEFAHTVVVLPDHVTPVLTKELLYTGITRAKQQLTLVVPDQNVFDETIKRKITRVGGLFS